MSIDAGEAFETTAATDSRRKMPGTWREYAPSALRTGKVIFLIGHLPETSAVSHHIVYIHAVNALRPFRIANLRPNLNEFGEKPISGVYKVIRPVYFSFAKHTNGMRL
jgi:hypothetical protein